MLIGKEVAKFVQRHFIDELKKNPCFIHRELEKALKQNFLRMDEILMTEDGQEELKQIKNDFRDEGFGYQANSFAGCTANVALIHNKKVLYVANAGDSRSVLSSKGYLLEMSYDHKPDNELEKKRIMEAGGFVTEGRVNANLNLSRALGDLEYKQNMKKPPEEQLIIALPDVKKRELSNDDEFLLMGCDGIWEMMPGQELLDFINSKLKEKAALKGIMEQMLEKVIAPDTSRKRGGKGMGG